MYYLLGIDLGTTGAKSIIIEKDGRVISSATEEYPMLIPKSGWIEQNPADWWEQVCKSIKIALQKSKVSPSRIKGVGLTGQMHGLVLLDKEHNILRPCIMWNDQRAEKQCEIINKKFTLKELLKLVGNPALPGFTLPKLLWVKEQEPEIYKKIHKILLPKDFIRFKLTEKFATDVSDASGMLLLDVKNRKWCKEILKRFGILTEWLPDLWESQEITGEINKDAEKSTGLISGTPVVAGAGDQAAQAVGSGIIEEGLISVTIGTSGVVFSPIDEPKFDMLGRLHSFCHAGGRWHLMGVMLSAGGSLRWFRDTFCDEEKKLAEEKNLDVYKIMMNNIKNIPDVNENLIFLPYLTGERTPYADPRARGVFFGINIRHRKEHFTKAVLEGVTFGLKDSLDLMENLRIKTTQVRLSGGGAKSDVWAQIVSDVFNCEVVRINITEGAAYGAALLSGVGSGVYKNLEEACKKTIKITDKFTPMEENVKKYKTLKRIYTSLYFALREEFKKVDKIP